METIETIEKTIGTIERTIETYNALILSFTNTPGCTVFMTAFLPSLLLSKSLLRLRLNFNLFFVIIAHSRFAIAGTVASID